ALDLVAAVHGFSISEAINWSRQWLGQDHPGAEPTTNVTAVTKCRSQANDRWCEPWRRARPITKTLAASYLHRRGLRFDDPNGDALRFAERHARRNPTGELEHHPALLALLRDVKDGGPAGTINVYL